MTKFNRFKLRLDGRISQKYSHGIHDRYWRTTPLTIENGHIVAPGRKGIPATPEQIREHYSRDTQYKP
jgi:hypothetical protein